MLGEQRERILVGEARPVQIELEVDELRIDLVLEDLVAGRPFQRRELEVVVVVRELESGVAAHRAPLVELRHALPPAGEVLAEVVRRNRDVVLPDRLRRPDLSRGVLPHERRADVRAGRDELQPVERRAHLLRRPVVVAGELHVLVADLRDLRERAVEVRLELIADGVELQPDQVRARRAARRGGRRARADAGARARGEEAATRGHRRELEEEGTTVQLFLLVMLGHVRLSSNCDGWSSPRASRRAIGLPAVRE